ncbi:MAG: NAD(P)-binding protein [Nitrososphaeria archaeon]
MRENAKYFNLPLIKGPVENPDFTILGGGWAGLLCAYELNQKFPNANIMVLEASKDENLGGLLRSQVIEGFTFDVGGPHILFSKNKDILMKIVGFLGDNVTRIERNAFVLYQNKYVPYPFENGIYVLDPDSRAKIGTDIIEAMLNNAKNPDWVPVTFKDWIYGFFGKTMGTEYLEPYNRKIWKTDPAEMDAFHRDCAVCKQAEIH